jgi:predicted metalloendopeptidase
LQGFHTPVAPLQARMLQTGVVVATLPWADARRVLSVRLHARSVETALRARLLQADAALPRHEADAIVANWRKAALTAPQASVFGVETHPPSRVGDSAGESATVHGTVAEHVRLMQQDRDFLCWLNAVGKQTTATDIEAVKQRAVACSLQSLLSSDAGDNGVIAALQRALSGQPDLRNRVIEALSCQ